MFGERNQESESSRSLQIPSYVDDFTNPFSKGWIYRFVDFFIFKSVINIWVFQEQNNNHNSSYTFKTDRHFLHLVGRSSVAGG